MARKYVFADECGNFDFSPKGSRYFILVSVTLDDCALGHRLLELRRDLAYQGVRLDLDEFHAAQDKQAIRDQVFARISAAPLRVDATILEKRKTYPHVRKSEERFYQTVWYQHMKFVAPKIASPGDDLLVVSASVGTAKKRRAFHAAVREVFNQVRSAAQVACWQSVSEPCLQVADYCAWAIQRKWEGGDARSYELIKAKVRTEFDLFATGTTLHY